MWRMTWLVTLLALPTPSAPGQAANPGPATHRGVFWYESGRPIQSLQYRIYDLRDGEFDAKAVDRWLETIRANHPGHGAYVRDVPTAGEPGATEPERLAAALAREKERWAGVVRRQDLTPAFRFYRPSARGPSPSFPPSRLDLDRPPGSPGGSLAPPSSPFPYPYRPRPL